MVKCYFVMVAMAVGALVASPPDDAVDFAAVSIEMEYAVVMEHVVVVGLAADAGVTKPN